MKVSDKLVEIAGKLEKAGEVLEIIFNELKGACADIKNEVKTIQSDERVVQDAKADAKIGEGPTKAKKG